MKRALYIWILTGLTLAVCPKSVAQNYLGASLGGNFVQTLDKLDMTHAKLSGGGELGLVYEWQREYVLFRTGIGYSLQCPSLSVDAQRLEQPMMDTRGMAFLYRGLLDHRTDRLTLHQLTVPLMVGGEWHGVYALAGLKMSLSLVASARSNAELATLGDYLGRYYADLEHMPNHGYHDFEPVESRSSVALRRLDLRFAAEAGYTLRLKPYNGLRPSPLLRLGVFAEYGLLNMHRTDNDRPCTDPDWSAYLHVKMTPVYGAQESNNSRAHLLLYGLRFTILFPVSSSRKNHSCRCAGMW